jgi:hypothetical protein
MFHRTTADTNGEPRRLGMDFSLVGRAAAPFEMVVEAGKVREFARATKSSNPAYLGANPISPVTFLMASEFWTGPENSAWGDTLKNFERLLHGEQEFVFHGPPPRAGTRLTGVAKIEAMYEKEGKRGGTMQFATLLTEYRDAETGELLVESRATVIETSKTTTS